MGHLSRQACLLEPSCATNNLQHNGQHSGGLLTRDIFRCQEKHRRTYKPVAADGYIAPPVQEIELKIITTISCCGFETSCRLVRTHNV